MTSSVVLCTLCLNESEWLARLYAQHIDWPGLKAWVFVEATDRAYAEANPHMTRNGLSVDDTSFILSQLAGANHKVRYIPYGFCGSADDPAQGKCEARTAYLQIADEYKPDFLFVLDADEFYSNSAQHHLMECMKNVRSEYSAFCFKQRHLWRPHSILHRPLTDLEVVGGFWDIPHTRGYVWEPNLIYRSNHNTPETVSGVKMDRKLRRFDCEKNTPYCVHTGYASSAHCRAAKNRYYELRGESVDPKRRWYVESRAAFETWKPNDQLPRGASVIPYRGEVPELLKGFENDD